MSKSWGQVIYEHMRDDARTRYPARLSWLPWADLREGERDAWEAAALAAFETEADGDNDGE